MAAIYTTPFKPSTLKLYGGSENDTRTMSISANPDAVTLSYADDTTPALKFPLRISGLETPDLKVYPDGLFTSGTELTVHTQLTNNAAGIVTNTEGITAEAATARAAESANATLIANESTARISADSTLQNNIDAEEAARTSADTTLQGNIDAEVAARTSADTTLQGRIDAEATTARAAEQANTTLIDTNTASIQAILNNTDQVALNSLQEIVSHFEAYGLSYAQRLFRIEEFIEDAFGIGNFNDGQETMPASTNDGPDFN